MTLEECLRLPAVGGREFPVSLLPCLSGPWMERPALKARDKAWLGRGTKLHPVQPFLLDALRLHQLPPPLPPSTLLAAALSDGSSCSQLLLDPQAVATAAPVATAAGREILDAACRPCRHWQPAKSTAPTVVCQPMRGEICRAISQ